MNRREQLATWAEMHAMLKSLEWAGRHCQDQLCPICGRVKGSAHQPECRLASLLNRCREAEPPPCDHEALNDHGDFCLDCGATYFIGEGWR